MFKFNKPRPVKNGWSFVIQKLAELQAYDFSAPGQDIDIQKSWEKEKKMADITVRFKPEMAEKFGVNAAIVAQLIWEKITEEGG